jgi:hypothetical protein
VANTIVAFEGWGASGVAWGDQPWGQGTGSNIEAAGEIGIVIINAVAVTGVTGQGVLADVGDETVIAAANVDVSGFSASSALSIALVTASANVSAAQVVGFTSLGSATTVANSNAVVSGVLAEGIIGYYLVWGLLDTTQNPNWSQILNTQSAGWGDISTPQSPNWTQIAA